MSKARSTTNRKSSPAASPEADPLEQFSAFLASADRVALTLLVTEGVLTDPRLDQDRYFNSIDALAKQFCDDNPDADPLDLDYDNEWTKIRAAHMVGLALGLRLRGVSFTAIGGAK